MCVCTNIYVYIPSQAHYRGYRLRTRLRQVLESARYSDQDTGDGEGSDQQIDFEEEIVVDFLDVVHVATVHIACYLRP